MSQSTDRLKQHATGQVATTPFETLRLQLLQRRNDLSLLIGGNVDKFIQVTLNAVTKTPELLSADRASLFFACKACALDGLMPDGKDAVFNIYNTKVKKDGREVWVPKVQYLPMVRGLIKLLWETGLFTYIDAAAVYDRDQFHFRRGENPSLEHEPYAGEDDPGKVKAAYFIAKTKSGEVKREVMWRRDIEKARASSKNSDRGPWIDWYDQMAIKSVVHRAYKQLPGVPDTLEGVIDRDMASTLSGGISEVLSLPETAGGEPVPEGLNTIDQNQPAPLQETAQAESPAPKRGKATPVNPTDPGASPGPGTMTMIDAMAAIGRKDYDIARDIGRSLGAGPSEEVERLIGEELKS